MAQPQDPQTDDFEFDFVDATKNAPRTWRPVFPILAVLVIAGVVFSFVWGSVQIVNAYASTSAKQTTPVDLTAAESNYFDANGTYTRDLSKLKDDTGQAFAPGFGSGVQVEAVCSTGWVAKIIESGASDYYLNSMGDRSSNIDSLPLPTCMTASDLGKDSRTSEVTVSNITVARSTKVGDKYASGSREGAHIVWNATDQCEPNEKPTYQVNVQMQHLDGATGNTALFVARSFTTTAKSLQVADVKNGMTYAIQVQGSCGTNFTNTAAITTFTQTLPKPIVLMNRSNGKWNVNVASSSSPFITYNIEYKHAYSEGWTSFATGIKNSQIAAPSGYYYGYGDLYRAKAVRVDGSVTSDYGNARGLRSSDSTSSYSSYNYYSSY